MGRGSLHVGEGQRKERSLRWGGAGAEARSKQGGEDNDAVERIGKQCGPGAERGGLRWT